MSIEDATKHFIEPMRVYFGDPPGDYPDLQMRDYAKALQEFLPSVLERTADHMKIRAKRRTWPVISECVEAAKQFDFEAKRGGRAPCGNGYRDPEAARKQRDERDRLADDSLYTATAITAAEQGWILEYHEFIRTHGRKPHGGEFDRLQRDAGDYEAVLNARLALSDPEPGRMPTAADYFLISSAKAVVARRAFLTKKVLDWANGTGRAA